ISALVLIVSGCATGAAMRAGQRAEVLQEYDRAIVEYTKVLREDPDNRAARQALDRMKLRSSLDHFTRGRRLHAAGRLDEALVELQIANELNPSSGDIEELLTTVRTQLRNKIAVAREGKTELESLVERARLAPAPGLELDAVLPVQSLTWNGSARDLYSQIGKLANISVAFDAQFRDQPINIDIRNQSLSAALQAISASTRNFFQVTAPRTVTIVPDTPAKRQEYEEEIVQVFPLSNADLKETADALRIVIDNRRLSVVTANNTITIKDTPERVAAAGKLIAAIDKARPEVVIDVEILEVDRTRLKEYGLQLASPTDLPTGINGSAVIDRDDLTLRDLRSLSQSDILLTNLPGLFYRLLKQDTNTRTLANTQLRISEGQSAQARFGERVPIPITQFAPIATGGIAQQPITSFQYENIGVNLDIMPRTHHDDHVTLALKVEVSSISGQGFGGLPTFGNRAISTVNRLRDGETNLLAGLIRDDERVVRRGIPGLSDIPAVGHLFAHTRRETQETDIVVTLTPRIIRVLDVTEEDLRAFRVGRDSAAAAGFELQIPLPGVVPLDPAQQPPPEQQPQPQGPILQPAPTFPLPPAPPTTRP
ncbi:MAG TPA: secretin N-terminal domain-containing protein, partial [Burkholderiaceae bacterium]|nr:secretin N-terminal domain-containing protein [Burkholderiaceae bacterium]